MRLNDRHVNV